MRYTCIPYLSENLVEVVTNSGSRIKTTYQARIDKNGVLTLEKSGVVDTYAEIQADRDLCDINLIVAKYTLGDTSVLDRVRGIYGDFTQMPSTLAEAYDMVLRAENSFESLPVEIKEKFNNSASEFLAAFDSGKVSEVLKEYLSPISRNSDNRVEKSETANERSSVDE